MKNSLPKRFMRNILKNLIIILILFIVPIISIIIYYNNVEIKPEELYLTKENSGEEFKANTGGFSWKDKGRTTIADSISPLQMDFSKSIDVKANDKIYFSDCNWTNVGATVILAKERKEIAKVTIETNLEEKYIVIPELALGEYVIQLNLQSEKGNVWYAVKINIE